MTERMIVCKNRRFTEPERYHEKDGSILFLGPKYSVRGTRHKKRRPVSRKVIPDPGPRLIATWGSAVVLAAKPARGQRYVELQLLPGVELAAAVAGVVLGVADAP